MQVQPYLFFNGQCAQALAFYQQLLGARLNFKQTFGESPMAADLPAESHGLIMHANFSVGDSQIMASDGMPGQTCPEMQGCALTIGLNNLAKGEQLFNALAEGGKICMPFEKTFWARGFGNVTDRFGVNWMINVE
ncbi:VOC family protein [Chitinibacter sp. S2-10]|uniref:VOC family protein n=1 Tax=Chitinibacter sp. S2-10 TaxID=3373597 RepID=UPI003977D2B2